jgi:hypothetical protein
MQPRPTSLDSLIFQQTHEFERDFVEEYMPAFQEYQLKTYNQLIECYQRHIPEDELTQPKSSNLMAYYDCYKAIMRGARAQNKQIYA